MMDSGSGSTTRGRDPAWKYCTPIEGNKNDTVCNFCGMVIKSSGITRFKFHLSHTDPYSNRKKYPNVPPEVKKEMRQLLVERNKAKAKKVTNIEEIRAELLGTMGGSHRDLFDDGDDDEEENEEENEEEEDGVYMYPVDMNLDERADYRAACCASKASELNRQQEEGFMRGKRKIGKPFNLNSLL